MAEPDPTREAVLEAIIRAWSMGEDTKDADGVPAWMNDAAAAAIAVLGDMVRARDLVQRWQADRGAFPERWRTAPELVAS